MELYSYIRQFLKTVPKPLNLSAILSFSALFFKITFLNKIVAPLAFLVDLGILFESVLASVVASYFFYLIVVHKKHFDEVRSLSPLIDKHIDVMFNNTKSSISEISKRSKIEFDIYSVDQKSLEHALRKIKPDDKSVLKSPDLLSNLGWLDYLSSQKEIVKDNSSRVIVLSQNIDHHIFAASHEINSSDYFRVISYAQKHPDNFESLKALSITYYEFIKRVRDIGKLKLRAGDD